MEQYAETLIRQIGAIQKGNRRLYLMIKSIIDRILALICLILLSPLMMLIMIAVYIDSGGPAIFRQQRVGKNGRVFSMLKFRTMCNGAESMLDQLQHLNEESSGLIVVIKNDPRVTRLGRFLRATSLDELPQLVNILKGDMSLVGPRPPSPDEVLQYDEYQLQRLSTTPGLTGLWQVSGRKDLTFDDMVKLDIEYSETQSLWLDLAIIAKTLPAVMSMGGAR